MDEDGNLQHPLPFNTELGVMEPYERALQYKGENVVQVNWWNFDRANYDFFAKYIKVAYTYK